MPTNTELVALLQRALAEKWGYVWGENGSLYTKEKAEAYAKVRRTPPEGRSPITYWTKDCAQWIGRMAADCSGLIVWAMRELGVFKPTQDWGSAQFKASFTEGGKIATIPDIPGLGLWRSGHIGVYVGNGDVIEAKSTGEGVVLTKLKNRNFTHWGKFPGIGYDLAADDPSVLIRAASCAGDDVHIRNGRSSSTESQGQVNKGHPLIAGEPKDKWTPVATLLGDKPVGGWMFSEYVSR